MPDPRVPMLDSEAALAAADRAGVPAQMAELSVFRVLLRHEGLAAAVHGLLAQLLWDGCLDARLRELVIMRIGWVQGSDYEWTQHWRVARMFDVSEADLLAVRDWPGAAFGPSERAVLAATDETLQSGAISASTWAALEQHLPGAEARLELVMAIANWTMFAQLLRSLAVPLEPGVESWPPDGVPSPRSLTESTSALEAT